MKLNETFQLRHIKICNSAYICTSNMNFKIRLKHFSYNFEASRNKILSQMSLNLKWRIWLTFGSKTKVIWRYFQTHFNAAKKCGFRGEMRRRNNGEPNKIHAKINYPVHIQLLLQHIQRRELISPQKKTQENRDKGIIPATDRSLQPLEQKHQYF